MSWRTIIGGTCVAFLLSALVRHYGVEFPMTLVYIVPAVIAYNLLIDADAA